MLSFEEKRAVFLSFQLKEKEMSNGRLSFVYPESKQRGQVLATQLHPSGNGYVIGKYMPEQTIKTYGYEIDLRGWISIKDFTKDELFRVIALAIKSMGGSVEHAEKKTKSSVADSKVPQQVTEPLEPSAKVNRHQLETIQETYEEKKEPSAVIPRKEVNRTSSPATYEPIACTLLYGWVGFTLTTIEISSSFWKKVRNYSR